MRGSTEASLHVLYWIIAKVHVASRFKMVTVQRQRLRRPHPQNYRLVILLVGTTVISFLVLLALGLAFFKLSSSSATETTNSTSTFSIPHLRSPQTQTVHKIRQCTHTQNPYGCIIRPPELTNDIRKDVEEIKEAKGADIAVSYGDRYSAAMSLQGRDHIQNQDRGIIISPFQIPVPTSIDSSIASTSTGSNTGSSQNDFLVAIYDGHGDDGHLVAQYLQDHLHERIADKLSSSLETTRALALPLPDDIISRLLNATFLEMDEELPHNLGQRGGSTASVILRLGRKLYFANAGDSLSFLASYDRKSAQTTIVHKNRFDKPYLPDEKERVERMGGKVHIPPHPINARVVAFDRFRHEMVTLGMSRAIGDWYHGEVGVIAEPIVDVVDLDDIIRQDSAGAAKEYFVVSACDGLYDHRTKEFVAAHLAKCFFAEQECHPVVESVNIIDLATPTKVAGYHDDMTLSTLRIIL